MKKRLTALMLALSLTLTLCPAALASDEVRETHFFPEVWHADIDYYDMVPEVPDAAPLLAEAEAIAALSADPANAAEAEERFHAFTDGYLELYRMWALWEIRRSLGVSAEEAVEASAACKVAMTEVGDALQQLLRTLLESPCGGFLHGELSKKEVEALLDYTPLTEEQRELARQEAALVAEYNALDYFAFTTVYDGKTWDLGSAAEALESGELDQFAYDAVFSGLCRQISAAAGDIYLRLVKVRRRIAESHGYDSYPDYAFKELRDRDYTPAEVRPFVEAVREHTGEANDSLKYIFNFLTDPALLKRESSLEEEFERLLPYFARMSGELAEVPEYLRRYHLYEFQTDERGGTSYLAAFTSALAGWNEAFLAVYDGGGYQSVGSIIHELGHCARFYEVPLGWHGETPLDSVEVHSQGLELLFTRWYPELYGEEAGAARVLSAIRTVYANIADFCMVHELEQYAYDAGDTLTVQGLEEKRRELNADYGRSVRGDVLYEGPGYEWWMDEWLFGGPFYYISYSVSAAGAFAFWLEAQEDYFAAVDRYLRFLALDGRLGFQESFEAVGMESPLSAAYVEALNDALDAALDLSRRADSVFDWGGETPRMTVFPKTQTVLVDGEVVEFPIYELQYGSGDTVDYYRFRDFAAALDGTPAQFDIAYDPETKETSLLPGASYTPNGSEWDTPFSGERAYRRMRTQVFAPDGERNFLGILMTDDAGGGYRYGALDSLCWTLDVGLHWDTEKRMLSIETDKSYAG